MRWPQPSSVETAEVAFRRFFEATEPPLRRALIATYGGELGRELAAEALAWAWEHHERLDTLTNPVAYLYQVGRSRNRRRPTPFLHIRPEWHDPWVEPQLPHCLSRLTERQRVAVILVHGYGWSLREVAELLGLKVTTVHTHLTRGIYRLSTCLEVTPNA